MPFALPALGLVAKLSGARKALARVPWQVWAVLALMVVFGVGSCVHKQKVEALKTERYNSGFADGQKSRDAEITALQRQLATRVTPIIAEVREKHSAETRAIDRRAADLGLRGTGKATCTSVAGVSSSAGEPEPGTGEADAAVVGVPDRERRYFALPATDTLAFAAQCDKNRATALAWSEWYNRISAEWAKATAERQ